MRYHIKYSLALAVLVFVAIGLSAQNKISVEEYIATYSQTAIDKMQEYGIPASITLAQGILESGIGNSELARNANNHFGIKCHKGWTGKTYHMDDDERNECFRKYESPDESYRDHSLFLTTRDRYADLFTLDVTDYKGWAHGLKKAGYATNPRYAHLLIKIIEENMLSEFDKGISPQYLARSAIKDVQQPLEVATASALAASPVKFELAEIWETGRKVYVNNGVKFIFADPGDTFFRIASDFEIYSWQLPKYNELGKDATLSEGQIVYIEKKKRRNRDAGTHEVRSGETMHDIAQLYGIQLKQLYRMNNMPEGINAPAGKKLRLK